MKPVDYLIVGFGLAAVSLCELLEREGKSFVVIDNNKNYSSKVSGGLYNPVILKRFTLSWNAKAQLATAMPIYKRLEQQLNTQLDFKFPVRRKFTSVQDQNNWAVACDNPKLREFLNPEIIPNSNSNIIAPFGFGQVKGSGKIDTVILLQAYQSYLMESARFNVAEFNYQELDIHKEGVTYGDLKAKRLIFSEGFGLKKNPYFDSKHLKGNKGELLIIHAPALALDFVVKTDVFIIPLGDHKYSVGATYNWQDKDLNPTAEGKQKLLNALHKLMDCEYVVVDYKVGIRPTVSDRRPLVGTHPKYKQLALLNGLGTRGIMIAPTVARQLYEHLERGKSLPEEINWQRFYCT